MSLFQLLVAADKTLAWPRGDLFNGWVEVNEYEEKARMVEGTLGGGAQERSVFQDGGRKRCSQLITKKA